MMHTQAPCGAMVLAAGRGERMRPLTDTCPKPLLSVRGKPLMQWPIEALARAGVRDILVNTAWLGDRIEAYFDNPATRWAPDTAPAPRARTRQAPVRLVYSHEGRDFGAALETAGGIVRALPNLADPFWLLAGDVFAPEFVFADASRRAFMASSALAHIWLVPNPPHNPLGDFALSENGLVRNDGPVRLTYSTIGLFRHALFAPPYCSMVSGNPQGVPAKLAPLLRLAAQHDRLTAQLYTGPWTDVGTPERLAQLQAP
jgi:N-acetyl-alpha-D-muramate 1-phosphate uridylyltransferase